MLNTLILTLQQQTLSCQHQCIQNNELQNFCVTETNLINIIYDLSINQDNTQQKTSIFRDIKQCEHVNITSTLNIAQTSVQFVNRLQSNIVNSYIEIKSTNTQSDIIGLTQSINRQLLFVSTSFSFDISQTNTFKLIETTNALINFTQNKFDISVTSSNYTGIVENPYNSILILSSKININVISSNNESTLLVYNAENLQQSNYIQIQNCNFNSSLEGTSLQNFTAIVQGNGENVQVEIINCTGRIQGLFSSFGQNISATNNMINHIQLSEITLNNEVVFDDSENYNSTSIEITQNQEVTTSGVFKFFSVRQIFQNVSLKTQQIQLSNPTTIYVIDGNTQSLTLINVTTNITINSQGSGSAQNPMTFIAGTTTGTFNIYSSTLNLSLSSMNNNIYGLTQNINQVLLDSTYILFELTSDQQIVGLIGTLSGNLTFNNVTGKIKIQTTQDSYAAVYLISASSNVQATNSNITVQGNIENFECSNNTCSSWTSSVLTQNIETLQQAPQNLTGGQQYGLQPGFFNFTQIRYNSYGLYTTSSDPQFSIFPTECNISNVQIQGSPMINYEQGKVANLLLSATQQILINNVSISSQSITLSTPVQVTAMISQSSQNLTFTNCNINIVYQVQSAFGTFVNQNSGQLTITQCSINGTITTSAQAGLFVYYNEGQASIYDDTISVTLQFTNSNISATVIGVQNSTTQPVMENISGTVMGTYKDCGCSYGECYSDPGHCGDNYQIGVNITGFQYSVTVPIESDSITFYYALANTVTLNDSVINLQSTGVTTSQTNVSIFGNRYSYYNIYIASQAFTISGATNFALLQYACNFSALTITNISLATSFNVGTNYNGLVSITNTSALNIQGITYTSLQIPTQNFYGIIKNIVSVDQGTIQNISVTAADSITGEYGFIAGAIDQSSITISDVQYQGSVNASSSVSGVTISSSGSTLVIQNSSISGSLIGQKNATGIVNTINGGTVNVTNINIFDGEIFGKSFVSSIIGFITGSATANLDNCQITSLINGSRTFKSGVYAGFVNNGSTLNIQSTCNFTVQEGERLYGSCPVSLVSYVKPSASQPSCPGFYYTGISSPASSYSHAAEQTSYSSNYRITGSQYNIVPASETIDFNDTFYSYTQTNNVSQSAQNEISTFAREKIAAHTQNLNMWGTTLITANGQQVGISGITSGFQGTDVYLINVTSDRTYYIYGSGSIGQVQIAAFAQIIEQNQRIFCINCMTKLQTFIGAGTSVANANVVGYTYDLKGKLYVYGCYFPSGNSLGSGSFIDYYKWLYDGSSSSNQGNGECTKYNTNYEATIITQATCNSTDWVLNIE